MRIGLFLTSCRVGDVAKPETSDDDFDEEEENSPYAGIAMTETEKQAVFDLLREAWSSHDQTSSLSRFRLETPDGPVTVRATGLCGLGKFPHFKVVIRALTEKIAGLIFALMRDGNFILVPEFDQRHRIVVSEERRRYVAEHMSVAQVCSSPQDLQRYLAERMESHRRIKPYSFQVTWEDVADDAEAAGRLMQRDRATGEAEFQRLHDVHRESGTLYLSRGRAYEALGQKGLAAADYRKALVIFPRDDLFREGALRALARVSE